MATLQNYIDQSQFYLHDPQGTQFPVNPTLVRCINTARRKVAQDTFCSRRVIDVTLTTGTTSFAFPTIPQVYSVLDIQVIQDTFTWYMQWFPFNEFQAYVNRLLNYNLQPIYFTEYSDQTVRIYGSPDQDYSSKWDCAIQPDDMPFPGAQTTQDLQITAPFTDLVPYYTCVEAYFGDKAYDEATYMDMWYKKRLNEMYASIHPRRRRYYDYGWYV